MDVSSDVTNAWIGWFEFTFDTATVAWIGLILATLSFLVHFRSHTHVVAKSHRDDKKEKINFYIKIIMDQLLDLKDLQGKKDKDDIDFHIEAITTAFRKIDEHHPKSLPVELDLAKLHGEKKERLEAISALRFQVIEVVSY